MLVTLTTNMTHEVLGLPQNPFGSVKTKSIPKVFALPSCSKGSELQPLLDAREHRRAELALLQAKKYDAHLLSKLSPYFRSSVSKELLKENWSSNETLPSLCHSCNRTLDRRHEQTISFNRIKLKRRAIPNVKGGERKDDDIHEHLTTSSPWKHRYREQHLTSQDGTICTPYQRYEKAQSSAELSKQCFTSSSPLILPEVIKITPQQKTTTLPRQKVHTAVHDSGLVPPPTPTIRYLRNLSPELRSLFVIRMASGSSPLL